MLPFTSTMSQYMSAYVGLKGYVATLPYITKFMYLINKGQKNILKIFIYPSISNWIKMNGNIHINDPLPFANNPLFHPIHSRT